jgi:probable rRNA maturation factor
MSIIVVNRQRTKKINARLLKPVVAQLLAELKVSNAELGITLIGAKQMVRINWQFLQHEGSTDVITFSYATSESQNQEPELNLHGELFICVDEAIAQAKRFKTSWQSEVVRYVVHGVLHLLGHDDLKPNLRGKMKRAENRLVRRLEKRFALAQLALRVKMVA